MTKHNKRYTKEQVYCINRRVMSLRQKEVSSYVLVWGEKPLYVAQRFGLSVGTVKNYCSRARRWIEHGSKYFGQPESMDWVRSMIEKECTGGLV